MIALGRGRRLGLHAPRADRRTGPALLSLLAIVAVAALVPAAGPAWAGNGLAAADPPDGAALAAAPSAVVLTFSAVPDPALSHISVQDNAEREVGTGDAARTGRRGLRLAVSIRAAGDYTTAYHVVFEDGSDAVGVLRFSVGTGVAPQPLGAGAVRQAQQAVVSGHDHGVDPLSGGLLVIDFAVFVGVVLMLMRRRTAPRPRFDAPDPWPTDEPDSPASS